MYITADEVKELDFRDLVDLIYEKLQSSPNQVFKATIQYQTKEGEDSLWTLDLIDEQDITDVCIFIKGLLSVADPDVYLQQINFSTYPRREGEEGNNWRENAASQAQQGAN